MKKPKPWQAHDFRVGLRYPVSRVLYSDAFGTAWSYYRRFGRKGWVVKFWTRKGAQRFADRLNAKAE